MGSKQFIKILMCLVMMFLTIHSISFDFPKIEKIRETYLNADSNDFWQV